MFIHEYPYTNFHEMNLDWLLREMKELEKRMTDFEVVNKITYAGEWDISKGYPRYSLVVYEDTGYIAVQPVPVGVDIGNADYWVEVANFTAEIADLGERVTDLETEVAGIGTAVDNIPDYIAPAKARNIVFFGDSWAVGTGASASNLAFPARVQQALEMVGHNFAVGGAGFTRPQTIAAQIEDADLTDEEIEKTSVVVICAGVNDIRHYTDTTLTELSNAVIAAAQAASSKFYNATIVMAVMTTVRNGIADTLKYWQGYIIDRLTAAAIKRVIVADMRYILYNRVNAYISDNFHPNDFGHGLVAGQIINAVLGSKSECYHYIETGLVFDSAVAEAPAGGHIFFNNGILNVTECRLNFVNAITERTLVGTVHAAVTPNNNVYTPFYYGDAAVGTFAITSNGNVYIIPESGQSLTTGFIQPFTYTA